MENPTKVLLNEIYIEARSGCETICGITSKIRDKKLLAETAAQLEMYAACANRAQLLLQEKDLGGARFSLRDRLSVRGGVLLETMHLSTQQELAELLQDSSRDSAGRMGRTMENLADRGCDPDALALGQRMMAFESAEADTLGRLRCE